MQSLRDVVTVSQQDGQVQVKTLFGLPLVTRSNPLDEGGLVRLWVDDHLTNTDHLPATCQVDKNNLAVTWQSDGLDIRLCADFDAPSGVLCWRVTIANTGERPRTIRRAGCRFAFPEDEGWSLYTQSAGWSRENRGRWTRFGAGEIAIGSTFGRTTRFSAPFVVLRDDQDGSMLAAHVRPSSDWRIALSAHADDDAVLTLGMTDQLAYSLAPGAELELPDMLLYAAEEPDFSAYKLHRYYVRKIDQSPFDAPPVAYNTWFFEFPILDTGRLREQLAAAKAIGCEVFVVDAGWYGRSTAEAWNDQGDWREKTDYAFHGQMRAFADEVRAAGLKFGLWCEAEAALPKTPVCQQHPDWFVANGRGVCHYDLTNPEAYAYLYNLICQLHDTYDLAWMKLDYNAEHYAGMDGHLAYLERWYGLLEAVRHRYPDFYLEGCASGAMRTELGSLPHYDGFFLSDNVNPYDVLRMSEGAFLRLPPGYLERWCTLRSIADIPDYGRAARDSQARTLVPEGGLWERAATCQISFPLTLGVMGILAFSGDLAGCDPTQKQASANAVSFYKQYRTLIRQASALLLTPPAPFSCRDRWTAIQLAQDSTNLIYVYRTASRTARFRVRPRQLDPARVYVVKKVFPTGEVIVSMSGMSLMQDGFTVTHPMLDEAAVYMLEGEAQDA